jgi:hypothetical protein
MARSHNGSRWIAVSFVMIIGLILWLGVLSIPGPGSIVYVVAVIGVAALLAYADRKRNASRKPGSR